ncbi:MAG: cyclase family protein [Spirochaetes bacterium]|nr:cyclase family protein [Spirochaetota bacterium]
MKIYDISVGISADMVTWPDHVPLVLEQFQRIADGEEANVSRMAGTVHIGTHVDAPLHFIDGAASIEKLPLDVLTGPAYVAHLQNASVIDAEVLNGAGIPQDTKRILFKTRNSNFWASGEKEFRTDYVGLNASGAEWLVERGIGLVGVDYLAVAVYTDLTTVHRILLGNDVIVLEAVDLSGVEQGRYELYCLPLKLMATEGAPARTILIEA